MAGPPVVRSRGGTGQSQSEHDRLSPRRSIRLYYCFVGAMVWMTGYNVLYPEVARRYYRSPPYGTSAGWDDHAAASPLLHHFLQKHPLILAPSSDPPPGRRRRRTPSHQACSDPHNQGVLHIRMGDIGGAAGTVFFQFVIGQILYAERNNLTPWVHLDNTSYVVYDEAVHGNPTIPPTSFKARIGREPTVLRRPAGHWRDVVPGPLGPPSVSTDTGAPPQQLNFTGTGVWEHYFEPVSDFVPGDSSCQDKWYVTLDLPLITPGIHGFADWAPSCWRYQYLPDYITKPHIPLTEWLEPQRRIAARVAHQYLHVQPSLHQKAANVNPGCSEQRPCLGLHIRHSDKAAGRRIVATNEFLPFVRAFAMEGGRAIYLATDSWKVLEEIQSTWPKEIVEMVRTIDNGRSDRGILTGNDGNNHHSSSAVVRSHDETAVFDLASSSHHLTNQQVLVEILALSQCQYMVHGLSAVSEAALWMNRHSDGTVGLGPLHRQSVNLEDPTHMTVAEFAALVQMSARQDPPRWWPPTSARTDPWWNRMQHTHSDKFVDPLDAIVTVTEAKETQLTALGDRSCHSFQGILHIAAVGNESSTGAAFFTHIVNQILFAERHRLLPWIHLEPSFAPNLYDSSVHDQVTALKSLTISKDIIQIISHDNGGADGTFAGPLVLIQSNRTTRFQDYRVQGNGIWETYFAPLSLPSDFASCEPMPLGTLDLSQISPGLDSQAMWSVKAWRYDGLPDQLWAPSSTPGPSWYELMRRKGHEVVHKYFRFRRYLHRRAEYINPDTDTEPCLAVHFRNGDKSGRHRKKVKSEKYLPYMEAFVEAGGKVIFVASDSHRVLQYMAKNFPEGVRRTLRSQGDHVVRSTKERNSAAKGWPTHSIGEHHRVNAETLVDVLAMSKCQFLLHTYSTVSEAAIYLNLELHNNSVNLEDPTRMTPDQFRRFVLRSMQSRGRQSPDTAVVLPVHDGTVHESYFNSTKVLRRGSAYNGICRNNAIVYLAQKQHSSYRRDSYQILLHSIDLLYQNYLSHPNHMNNTDVFIFHTGDFNQRDLGEIESRLGTESKGHVHLVDLSDSTYWARPKYNANDDPKTWYAFPLFSEGYRRMMHWYAIDIWDFFRDYNAHQKCNYRYIFRLDEDSFIHSPIPYDVFDFFAVNRFVYGYRLCAYEMKVAQRMWKWWKRKHPDFSPKRELDLDMCGFYNNFFVADLEFFTSPAVSAFLKFIDQQGHIYRRRLGDLMIHTMSVIAFAPANRIHRFLDFTYEHGTVEKDGCLAWGGIQAGYNDPNASHTLDRFYGSMSLERNCQVNTTFLQEQDLSPTYSHISPSFKGRVSLHTTMRGWVESSAGLNNLTG